jgi:hypothetical protein
VQSGQAQLLQLLHGLLFGVGQAQARSCGLLYRCSGYCYLLLLLLLLLLVEVLEQHFGVEQGSKVVVHQKQHGRPFPLA